MGVIRTLALAVVGGLIALGLVVDRVDRSVAERARARPSALAVAKDPVTTWFCPGGSGPGGAAELTVEILSRSSEPRTARVSVAPGGRVNVPGADFGVDIPPGGRTVLAPADAVPGAEWVGAVVEVNGSDVVVEQTVTGLVGGVGRSPCLTRAAESWVVPYGATRFEAEGERFVVMLLNPFPDDAVADVEFAADVGPDSLQGVVIPAGEVVAIDVTEEVTVASAVAVAVDVVAGRLSVSRLQAANGPAAGRGIRVAPGIPGGAPLWHLPLAAAVAGRRDLVAITNLSEELSAEVDIEILAGGTAPGVPTSAPDPIETTVRPGRTVVVDLSEMDRLAGTGPLSLVVQSLDGVPVAVSLDSVVLGARAGPVAPGSDRVVGTAAAYYLARDGHAVTVLERREAPGLETSYANAGLVAPGHSYAWASPAAPRILAKSLITADQALRLRPRLDPRMWSWLWRFLLQCTDERARANTRRKLRLCRYSTELLGELGRDTGVEYDGLAGGNLYVYRSGRSFEAGVRRIRLLRDEGLELEVLDRDGLCAREPALEPVR